MSKKYKGIWFFNFYIYIRPFIGLFLDLAAIIQYSNADYDIGYLIFVVILLSSLYIVRFIQLYKVYYNSKDAYSFVKKALYFELAFDIVGLIILTVGSDASSSEISRKVGGFFWFVFMFDYLKRRNIKDYLEYKRKNNANNSVKEEKFEYECENCGYLFNDDLKYCPKCGSQFEVDDNDDNNTQIINNYDDLIRLKELLDKKIITQKEFDEEKKRIIKSK